MEGRAPEQLLEVPDAEHKEDPIPHRTNYLQDLVNEAGTFIIKEMQTPPGRVGPIGPVVNRPVGPPSPSESQVAKEGESGDFKRDYGWILNSGDTLFKRVDIDSSGNPVQGSSRTISGDEFKGGPIARSRF